VNTTRVSRSSTTRLGSAGRRMSVVEARQRLVQLPRSPRRRRRQPPPGRACARRRPRSGRRRARRLERIAGQARHADERRGSDRNREQDDRRPPEGERDATRADVTDRRWSAGGDRTRRRMVGV
jgi:hypothetical protein